MRFTRQCFPVKLLKTGASTFPCDQESKHSVEAIMAVTFKATLMARHWSQFPHSNRFPSRIPSGIFPVASSTVDQISSISLKMKKIRRKYSGVEWTHCREERERCPPLPWAGEKERAWWRRGKCTSGLGIRNLQSSTRHFQPIYQRATRSLPNLLNFPTIFLFSIERMKCLIGHFQIG